MINLDFIKVIPRTRKQQDSIWVITDRVTKLLRFLALNTINSVEDYAKIYFDNIVKFHKVTLSIISYKGP